MFKNFYKKFSNDIGIDLGTANILVYVKGQGIVINEPSVVALNNKTGRIVAVGNEAKNMLGRTPAHIKIVRPIVDGVISDYEVTEEFLSYLINRANNIQKKFFRPRVVIGIPVGITNVEIRAVYDASITAGAREVYIVEEPMAAAIGMNLPIHEPLGSMVVDIGGGTTDIAIISLSGIVKSQSLKMAGDKMNQEIISYLRSEFKILIGEKTAEEIKIKIGSAMPGEEGEREMAVRGRNLVSGLPFEVLINDANIREAMYGSISQIIEATKEVLEMSPPEVLADIMKNGIILTGGGALIKNLERLFEFQLKVKTVISQEPLTNVVIGCSYILEGLEKYSEFLVKDTESLKIV